MSHWCVTGWGAPHLLPPPACAATQTRLRRPADTSAPPPNCVFVTKLRHEMTNPSREEGFSTRSGCEASASKYKPVSQTPHISDGPLDDGGGGGGGVCVAQEPDVMSDIRMEPLSPPLTPPTLQSPLVPLRHVVCPPPPSPHRLLSDQLAKEAGPRHRRPPPERFPGAPAGLEAATEMKSCCCKDWADIDLLR